MLSRIKSSGAQLLSIQAWKIRLVFFGGALLVGLIAAIFAILCDYANDWFREQSHQSTYLPFIITPLGLALLVWLTRRVFPGSQGSGIPQSIATIEMSDHEDRSRLLSLRIAFGKMLLTIGGLFSGASIGREGPTVHVGASIMYSLGHMARFPSHFMERGLVMAGGAAGIAAAFNTPLAGIMFAIEEMSRSFEQRTSGTLITAVVLAGITAIALHGNYTYFGTATIEVELIGSILLAIVVCGVIGGLLGGFFSFILVWGSQRIAPMQNRWPILIAAGCGLIIAVVGLLSNGQTFGTGYEEAKQVLSGDGEVVTGFTFYKMISTLASYLSGIPGGIFAPSLSAGAGLGAVVAPWFAGTPETAIVILCMAGFFSAVVQTPLTSIIIIMEMTNNQTLLLPIMMTSFIAYGISRIINHEAIYQALARPFIEQANARHKSKVPESNENEHLV